MLYWITSTDGSISFTVEAETEARALSELARSLGYETYRAMLHDLGYVRSSFNVAEIRREATEYDPEGNRIKLDRERDSLVTAAFKGLRRLAS